MRKLAEAFSKSVAPASPLWPTELEAPLPQPAPVPVFTTTFVPAVIAAETS